MESHGKWRLLPPRFVVEVSEHLTECLGLLQELIPGPGRVGPMNPGDVEEELGCLVGREFVGVPHLPKSGSRMVIGFPDRLQFDVGSFFRPLMPGEDSWV